MQIPPQSVIRGGISAQSCSFSSLSLCHFHFKEVFAFFLRLHFQHQNFCFCTALLSLQSELMWKLLKNLFLIHKNMRPEVHMENNLYLGSGDNHFCFWTMRLTILKVSIKFYIGTWHSVKRSVQSIWNSGVQFRVLTEEDMKLSWHHQVTLRSLQLWPEDVPPLAVHINTVVRHEYM